MSSEYSKITDALNNLNLDAYLIYDFRGSNHIGRNILHFNEFTTRRWIAVITRDGSCNILIPRLESTLFENIKGTKHYYSSHQELLSILKEIFQNLAIVALDISPNNDLPVIDIVPSGFVELLTNQFPDTHFVSSAELTQQTSASWGNDGLDSHRKAASHLKEIAENAWQRVAKTLSNEKPLTDYDISIYIMNEIKQRGMYAPDDMCIVSTWERTGNPHYWSTKEKNYPIEKNSVLLFDIWAKYPQSGSIFADVTFMAWIGPEPVDPKVLQIWNVVKTARDTGIEFVKANIRNGLKGYEVDREVRKYISSKGWGEFFIHRTGHSLDVNDHGNGANLDDFETHDTRSLVPDTGFTIEPGIYLPEFGIRSEVNLYIHPDGTPEVTTLIQDELKIVDVS